MKTKQSAITPTRSENYSEWYLAVIKAADMAEHSSVRGCMVIKPWGFGIWEQIQFLLNQEIKATGHQNVYFPLLIPLSSLEKEAEHVEGFAKECAVVTHSRLVKEGERLVPAGKLEEPFIIRPTSEMIIGEMFAKWISSYRDLPLLLNQWANVMRWEMRPRLFLRTSEFLWQEGHTAHATSGEAREHALRMLYVYERFCIEILAIPVILGEKTVGERFPGAVATYTLEAMMQDTKALQCGTSHYLGQNFSKAAEICFTNNQGTREYVWTTSWGVTTRLIGALIMIHSDDNGLIVPPRIAPSHLVIIPFIPSGKQAVEVQSYCYTLQQELQKNLYHTDTIKVIIDNREMTSGEKKWHWIKKGIPICVEIGSREVSENTVTLVRRFPDIHSKEKISKETFIQVLPKMLDDIQSGLYQQALQFQQSNIVHCNDEKELYAFFQKGKKGFVTAYFSGKESIEKQLQQDLGITVRCLPLSMQERLGKCIFTQAPSSRIGIFAKAY